MKCFVAIEEEILEALWQRHPELVAPFSRPFYPSELNQCRVKISLEAQSVLAMSTDRKSANDESIPTTH